MSKLKLKKFNFSKKIDRISEEYNQGKNGTDSENCDSRHSQNFIYSKTLKKIQTKDFLKYQKI